MFSCTTTVGKFCCYKRGGLVTIGLAGIKKKNFKMFINFGGILQETVRILVAYFGLQTSFIKKNQKWVINALFFTISDLIYLI